MGKYPQAGRGAGNALGWGEALCAAWGHSQRSSCRVGGGWGQRGTGAIPRLLPATHASGATGPFVGLKVMG